jgi:hypothetical protein
LILWNVLAIFGRFIGKTALPNPRFDRLAGVRRNRKMRNISAALACLALFLGVILALDPIVSGTPFHPTPVIIVGAVFVVFFSSATYFHMRFLSRE